MTGSLRDFVSNPLTKTLLVELNQPIDQIARARSLSRRPPRNPYQQHRRQTSLLQSLTSLVPSRSMSVAPQLPPLQLENWDVVWYTGPWISVPPSPPQSARDSVRSRPSLSRVSSAPTPSIQRTRPSTSSSHSRASTSMHQTQLPTQLPSTPSTHRSHSRASASTHRTQLPSTPSTHRSRSRASTSTHPTQLPFTPSTHRSRSRASTSTYPTQPASTPPTTATGPSAPSVPRRTTPRPRRPGTQSSSASEPLSPLEAALTTRTSGNAWKPGTQPRVMAKATMEGFIHYLLLTSAGDKSRSISCVNN